MMEPIFSRKLTAKFVPYDRMVPIFSRKLTAKFTAYTSLSEARSS